MPKFLPDWENSNIDDLKSFSVINVIAMDLDGTLLKSNSPNIWENILKLISILSKSKFKLQIIIATGRTFFGAKKTIESLYSKKDLPIILYNGALVIRNNDFKILYQKTIDKNALERIIDLTLKFNISVFAYFFLDDNNKFFSEINSGEYVLGWTKGYRPSHEFNKMEVIWDVSERHLKTDSSAILISINNETKENISNILELLNSIENISITFSGVEYIEIRPLNSDKSKALDFVSKLLNVKKDNILAIGDNDNDSEMLKWAAIGVAVNTGTKKALESSNFICKHDVASGVLELIRLIKHSKRYF
jgi:Cof subfamily protein (haloacid dehalogenase superfamily)